jgi:galactonate dehydratase
MKVIDVQTFCVDANWRNLVFVKLTTDTGLTGVGECTLETRDRSVMATVSDLSRYVLGQDPNQVEKIWNTMYRDGYWGTGPVDMSAISAIEQALWDIIGKKYGTPVYNLLGGKVRDKVKVYANGWYFGLTSIEQHVEKVGELIEKGYRAFKWDPFKIASREISHEDLDYAVECVAAVRKTAGPKVDLLIEGHGRFNVRNAIRIAKAMEPFDPFFIEEPIPQDNYDALKKVAEAVNVPLAAGERCYSYYHYRDLRATQALDIIQPDLSHSGGILSLKKIAAMAETWYVGVAPHNASGPVHTAANLQVDATLTNFVIQEYFPCDVERCPWMHTIVDNPPIPVDGYITLADRPGLGIELNEEEIAKHPPEERAVYSLYSEDSFLLTGVGATSDKSAF